MSSKLPFEVSGDLDFKSGEANKPKLKNPDLFKDKSYVDGEWVEAKSGKRFDVIGTSPLPHPKLSLTKSQIQETAKSGPQHQTTQPKT